MLPSNIIIVRSIYLRSDNMSKKIKYVFTDNNHKVILPGAMAAANAYLNKICFEEIINEALEWDQKQWNVSPGTLLKAVVLNTFSIRRAPLYKICSAYKDIDTERLFGEGVKAEQLTDAAIGEALERVYKSNAYKLFHTMSLSLFKKFNIPVKRLHSDTTSVTFYGSYDNDIDNINKCDMYVENSLNPIDITYGHNKDHRPDCKQLVLGQISNEAGIVLAYKCMDGNTSDVTWNKEALKLINEIQETNENSKPIYVADCKLITKDLFKQIAGDKGILFISRVPASFSSKLEAKMKEKAYKDDKWDEIGAISKEKNACKYEVQEYLEEVYGIATRLIVVKSSSSLTAFETSQQRQRIKLEKQIKEIDKKIFACEADALKEKDLFVKSYSKLPYNISIKVDEITKEIKPRGNPGKNPKPSVITTEYKLDITIGSEDQTVMTKLRQDAESFVLISNVPKAMSTATNILAEYKGQIVVELNFKTLKSPALTSTVYLEKTERIESLMMLMAVSLMIRAVILYFLRKGFAEGGQQPKIGYTGGKISTVTMGLFEYAMDSLLIEKQLNGVYRIDMQHGISELRIRTFMKYLNLEFRDLISVKS